jgi:ribonuclease-3
MEMTSDLKDLETTLGHQFRRPELLERALTHSSHAHEESKAPGAESEILDNEQYEFLGDAVLGMVTSQLLFERFPTFHEGQLSKLKAHLVSAGHLVGVATRMDLGRYLRLGKGEERSGGRAKSTLLSDAIEAVIAAMYLDSGMEKTRDFIINQILQPELDRISTESEAEFSLADYKSALQELLQSSGRSQPVYATWGRTSRNLFSARPELQKRKLNNSQPSRRSSTLEGSRARVRVYDAAARDVPPGDPAGSPFSAGSRRRTGPGCVGNRQCPARDGPPC